MQTNANTSVESGDVQTWSAWASRANNAYIVFLGLTLIATVVIVFFNNRLNKAKDAAHDNEKQASDEKISAAKTTAANALKDAGIANENAGKANERASGLELKAQEAQTALAEQRARTASLETLAAAQQERAAEAERKLLEAQFAIEGIENSVGDRIFETNAFGHRMKRFAGTRVLIVALDDREPKQSAEYIAQALSTGEWNVTIGQPSGRLPEDVTIQLNMSDLTAGNPALGAAADALKDELIKGGIEVFPVIGGAPDIPLGTIRVRVGKRSQPYFMLKKIEQMIEQETNPQRKALLEKQRDAFKKYVLEKARPK